MTKLLQILVLLAALAVSVAHAQSVDACTGAPSTLPPTPPMDLSKPLACERATDWKLEANGAGVLAYRYCYLEAENRFVPQRFVGTWAGFKAAPSMAVDVMAAGPNLSEQTMRALLQKYMASGSLADAQFAEVWCPFREKIAAGTPRPPPLIVPPPAIAAWLTSGTTVYGYSGYALAGVVGTTALRQPCDCTTPISLGVAIYCPLAGGPANRVARCTKP